MTWSRRDHYEPFRHRVQGRLLDPHRALIKAEWGKMIFTREALLRRLKEAGYQGGYSTLCDFIRGFEFKARTPGRRELSEMWMQSVLQGRLTVKETNLFEARLTNNDTEVLVRHVRDGGLRERNRALAILASANCIPTRLIARFLMIERKTAQSYISTFRRKGAAALFANQWTGVRKHEKQECKDAVFALLHAPPGDHGINRTTWRMEDIYQILRQQGRPNCRDGIHRIIKDAGFRTRSAKKVLTSTDPEYRQKLTQVTQTLSNLRETERFFSVDEFGPFAVKAQGGRALVGPGIEHVVPQWQKSKGSLTIVGALELSTNQITHFYARRKSTTEMIDLLYRLLCQYQGQTRLYLSWDAAAWHASHAFIQEVELVNSESYLRMNGTPAVSLAPLPACAQFLNVIESIYNGMAKAVIHNSDYASVDECKLAIDRYFRERNDFYLANPKRAGNKIWGLERVVPVFRESNNCKDPMYCRD